MGVGVPVAVADDASNSDTGTTAAVVVRGFDTTTE